MPTAFPPSFPMKKAVTYTAMVNHWHVPQVAQKKNLGMQNNIC